MNKENYMKEWREKHREHLSAYNKRYQQEHREEIRERRKKYRARNKDKIKETTAKWKENNPDYSRKYYQANAEKLRKKSLSWAKEHRETVNKSAIRRRENRYGSAHIAVQYAIKIGKLVKMPCEVCGEEMSEAHHDDYNSPLEVRWLCKKCHTEWHRHNTAKGLE